MAGRDAGQGQEEAAGRKRTKQEKKKKKTVHVEYYELVGCAQDASPEEIKKAYRKAALRLHPDRGGDPEDFKKMKAAYDVISDPNKRKMYDNMGPDAVKVMEGQMPGNPMDILQTLRKRDRIMLVVFITTVSLISLLFPILISIKWDAEGDGEDPYSWAVAFIPLWVLEVLLFVSFTSQVRQPPLNTDDPDLDAEARKMWRDNENMLNKLRAFATFFFVLQLLFQIFIALRLDGTVDWSWYAVFAPFMVFCALVILMRAMSAPDVYRAMRKDLQFKDVEEQRKEAPCTKLLTDPVFILFFINSIKWTLVMFITAFLIPFVAEHNEENLDDKSFYLAAIPVFIVIFIALLVDVFMYYSSGKGKKKPGAQQGDAEQGGQGGNTQEQNREASEEPKSVLAVVIAWLCKYAFLLIVVCTGASKLTDINAFSAFAIFSPIFFVVGCTCCLCSVAALTVTAEDMEEAEAEARAELNRNQQGEATHAQGDGLSGADGAMQYGTVPPPSEAIEDDNLQVNLA
ncbi:DnaJ protein homolog (DNAJ-1) [Durusdinium trenchii]|uniref:DnaJ protein homolog (DNAJ-1) n=1 Tax=Durusdinium trenchii TaxID=1381693 RepID=A0ABP0KJ98_9DINO